jgi:NAD(P)-dependent dehydrogenase (short-subunit alcohol dehydrogenase family)
MDLADRVVLLTGARRMGVPLATALAARGADVALVYRRSRADADAAREAVEAQGRRAALVQADLADPTSATQMIGEVDRLLGRLDVLVNMASTYTHVPFDEMTLEHWHAQLAVDLHGTFQASLAAVPLLRRSGGGRIINFADWVAASGRPRYTGYVAYYVAKAGVKALTEALALELAGDRILVNAIAPGPILAPPGTTEDESAAVARATPLGQWGGPGEIVKAVIALVESDFVTGETIRVDGGRHLS